MLRFYKEFTRRKMFRPLLAYAAFSFALIQVCDIVFRALLLPPWTNTFIVVLVILGFPITIFFAWVYDITPDGIRQTPVASKSIENEIKSSKILLPLSGFLTIVGGAFWLWYSLGDVTSGSDLDLSMGIKKSIAVFSFDNLTGKDDGDHICSGISEHIRVVLTSIAKLDVKSRRVTYENRSKDLDLDYYIDGSMTVSGERRNINVSIVNANSGSNLWSDQFQFKDEDILTYQDTIIQKILTELKIAPNENEITSSTHSYKNPEAFKLMGKGVYHFDMKNYKESILAFDSVLESDPQNIVAIYNKANSYYELDNFTGAMELYQRIFDRSIDIDPIQLRIPIPEKNDIHPILCENIEFIEEKDLAIMLLKGTRGSRLVYINTASGGIVREIPIDDQFDSSPVIINNTVFLASSRIKQGQAGEPTLYAYNISNGQKIFIQEFPRDNENQAVLFTILEKYNEISEDNSAILLSFNKLGPTGKNLRELVLIETMGGSTLWRSKVEVEWGFWADLMLVPSGNRDLLVLILENDIIALNNKTGVEAWRENFLGSADFVWNQKILQINTDEKYVALWDPISRKEVWKSYNGREYMFNTKLGINEFRGRMTQDVILLNFSDGGLVAINYEGGLFNWRRERWEQNVGLAEKIWFSQNMSNHVFCLTAEDSLFTINMDDGNIIKSLSTDGPDYSVYFDNSQNAMVLNNSEFLIGADPINGDQLWKIKDKGVDKVGLIGNSVMTAKTVFEDGLLLINNYNRDNGNLIWSKPIDISASLAYMPVIGTICGYPDCGFCGDYTFFLKPNYDKSLLLVKHDEILNIDAKQVGNGSVRQKDVQLQIARTYAKSGQLNSAIEAYKLLLLHDQINQDAHWELASIYREKNNVNKAAKSLINYYDLILPESSEGSTTIQMLQDMHILKWEKNISVDRFDVSNMEVDNEKIFIFINNNIEAHSIHSSARVWQNSFGDKNTSVVMADVINENYVFFIKKNVPDIKIFYLTDMLTNKQLDFEAYSKASKYSLVAVDKRDGHISWDVPLDIPGESDIGWMGLNNNKIFIQSRLTNKMFISSYDITGGDFLWRISRDISSLYTSFVLTPALYKGILLLPLATSIEYINADNGIKENEYSDENIDHIFFFNQNSIQNNTMNFFIEDVIDYEYVVVDLDKNINISSGPFDSDNPGLGMWINNNIFVDLSALGSIAAYKFYPDKKNDATLFWEANYNTPLELVGFDEQKIYLLSLANEQIIMIDSQSGIGLPSKPLLWPIKNIEVINDNFIIKSANKLFVVPM